MKTLLFVVVLTLCYWPFSAWIRDQSIWEGLLHGILVVIICGIVGVFAGNILNRNN